MSAKDQKPTGPSGFGDEFPDPDAPPKSSVAPGGGSPERGKGQFDEAYEEAGVDESGVSSTDSAT